MTDEKIAALRAQAELNEGIQARWEGVKQILDHALADGRDAVQQISKHRLELTRTDPVTRIQIAEEKLLEAHAKDFQPLLTELGKAVKKAGLQVGRYREVAKGLHERADELMPAPAPEKLQDADDFRKVFEDSLAEQFSSLAVQPLPEDAYPAPRTPPMRPELAHQPIEAFSDRFAKMTPMSKAPTPDPPERRPLSPGQVAARKRALKNVDKLIAGLRELDRLGLREQWIADNIEIVRELRNWLFA